VEKKKQESKRTIERRLNLQSTGGAGGARKYKTYAVRQWSLPSCQEKKIVKKKYTTKTAERRRRKHHPRMRRKEGEMKVKGDGNLGLSSNSGQVEGETKLRDREEKKK